MPPTQTTKVKRLGSCAGGDGDGREGGSCAAFGRGAGGDAWPLV